LRVWYWLQGCRAWFYWICWITFNLSTRAKVPKCVHGNISRV